MDTEKVTQPGLVVSQADPINDPDLELLRSWEDGHEEAFEELVRRNRKRAFCTAFRITRNIDDAEDVVQESFLKVFCKLSSFQERSLFSAWLTRIVINTSLGLLRRRSRRLDPISLDSAEHPLDVPDPGRGPEEMCCRSELLDMLGRCLQKMSRDYRSLLDLQILKEQPLGVTASSMGITVGAAKTRRFRARAMLRKAITESMESKAPPRERGRCPGL